MRVLASLLVLAVMLLGMAKLAALDLPALVVTQKDRMFSEKDVTLAAKGHIRFKNEDDYLHQLYVSAPAFSFDSGEQKPGEIVDVQFPVPGDFKVLCSIHLKMKLNVHVR